MLVFLDATGDQDAGEWLARGELQVGVVLIVPQQDVVLRNSLLDEVVLECERLDHRIGDDRFQPLRLVQKRIDSGADAVRPEVRSDAVPQHFRLTDVQSLAGPVEIQVNTRLFGQTADLPLEVLNRHAVDCGFYPELNP